ncbi:hypothetical protein [Pelagibaculum spongiae]|uniref:hypothetical protein n=1 Tax=Pelagibaculum spongiae TaxID=2080658 RepID=UPI001057E3B9|nr:hypothetical protein [Pelagibaculum spongiae]
MSKVRGYSRYQKQIIKRLQQTLGADTPFRHERTNNNHLKVLIQGADKPCFTSSTPSDNKSADNFIADVKRIIREINTLTSNDTDCSSANPVEQAGECKAAQVDQITLSCIKLIRRKIDQIQLEESESIKTKSYLSELKKLRLQVADETIKANAGSSKIYLTGKQINHIKNKLLQHLNFMLPTTADYAEKLQVNEADRPLFNNKTTKQHAVNHAMNNPNVLSELKPLAGIVKKTVSPSSARPQPVILPISESTDATGPNVIGSPSNHFKAEVSDAVLCDDSASEWLNQNGAARINALRQLNKLQLEQLAQDVQTAIIANRDQAIDEVVSLIQSQDLPFDLIKKKLEEGCARKP